jgi:hypothetical protein
MNVETDLGLLYTSKSDYTPAVYFIASLSDGLTVFEDETPEIVLTWRRLKLYCQSNQVRITKLRIQTPHHLLTFGGSYYRAFRAINEIQIAVHDQNNPYLNQITKIYSAIDQFTDMWEVYKVSSMDNWRSHVHTMEHVKEWSNNQDALSLSANGVIVFVNP